MVYLEWFKDGVSMIELYDHNKEAYEKTIDMLDKEKRCCIIHPTGTGKSYIALKWLYENRDKKSLFVTSSLSIVDNIEWTIRENGMSLEEDFPNLKIITYSKLMKNPYIDADNIVLDEFHRAGAEKWGEGVKELFSFNKDANVLGLSATPVRYLDGKRDMSEEIFNGNVSSHITLPYAIANGILPVPTYVNAIYSFKEDVDRIENKINNLKDEEDKKELEKELNRARRLIEQADNLKEIFSKYMKKSDGKYLVFCRDIKHLEEYAKICQVTWGDKKTDEELKKYTKEKVKRILKEDKVISILGLLDNDKLIGFISLFKYDGDEMKNITPWYATMYVKKEYRNKGYSKILNDAILNEAKKKGYDRIYLKSNLVNYYEKFGAKYIKTLNNKEKLYYIDL